MRNKFKYKIIILFIITFLYSCSSNNVNITKSNSTLSSSTYEYSPKSLSGPISNPLMGWAPPAQYTGYNQPYTLVYANLYWKDIQPYEGFYNFDHIEELFNFELWKSKNVKIILRVICDYPNDKGEKTIPEWLYNKINGDGTWYDIEYGKGFSPNYENEVFIYYHEKLIEALANRYDTFSQIAFIALGSIGHWGEWHTYETPEFQIPFVSEKTAKKYISHYTSYFKNKKLLLRTPNTSSLENSFGLFNDMLGDIEATDLFLDWTTNGYIHPQFKTYQHPMIDFWINSPSGGEFAHGNSGLQYLSEDTITETINQIKENHITFIGPNCPANQPLDESPSQEYIDSVLETMGYRFTITETKVKIDSDIAKITINLENNGVAPFYEQWPLHLLVLNETNDIIYNEKLDVDITSWIPGEHQIIKEIPKDIVSDTYSLALAIMDPSTNEPSIHFANDEEILPFIYRILTF